MATAGSGTSTPSVGMPPTTALAMSSTPMAPPGAKLIEREDWRAYASLPSFSIRDGSPMEASSLLLKATIPKAYHWVPIQDLDPVDGRKAVDGFIKSAIVQVGENNSTNMSTATIRKVGILLGTARAVSTTFYRLSENDLIPGEKAAPKLKAFQTATGDLDYEVMPGVSATGKTILEGKLGLTSAEQAAVCALITCSAGIIPMQGYSLIMNQHHYLSQGDSQSRKVFAVAEKAYWKSANVSPWFTADTELIQDVLWHKACHPVMINVKEGCAMSPDIKDILTAAGSGACASRLPAEESELRTASSYLTLMSTVNPMFQICGGSVMFEDLTYLADLVKTLPVNVVNPVLPTDMPEVLKTPVKNRSSGIRYLGEMLKRNQDSVAYCYGWYIAMADASMAMGGGGSMGTDTLKTSWSLSKLKSQSYASYIAGFQAYGDYQAVRNKQRAEGRFVAPSFTVG